jgi:hypothetical protein
MGSMAHFQIRMRSPGVFAHETCGTFPARELIFFKKTAEFSASIFNLYSKPFLTIFHDYKPFLSAGRISLTN